jgi:tetratricopeptide (TPR) repeat protein
VGALVDSRELRRFIVRIDGPEGRGTGFFAAPGWVVTCAHVVKGASTAAVVPADTRIDVSPAKWQVAARAGQPVPGSALWSYPDLAVLRADRDVDHPCPLLEARDPAGDHDCHSWGYMRHEPGVEPAGRPATFGFEGVDGSGFLQLKSGQAAPGLSGAPLVCPTRRAVVGIVTATRDAGTDLGGWAAPVSALLTGGEGVPDDLAKAGAQIRVANRAAAIRYRRQWNAVLPVDAKGVLDQPWVTEFVRGPHSTPASLLRADSGVVPYMFRDPDLARAAAWCENADASAPMAIMLVMARGGAGKTRFAIELCKRLDANGWVSGFWRGDPGLARVPLPRLVVIDYAEEAQAASLRDSLDMLVRQATALAPVQVLLLTRRRTGLASGALAELWRSAPATLTRVLDHSQDNPVADKPLTLEQRDLLYRKAVHRFATAWCPDSGLGKSGSAEAAVPDLSRDRYGLPLEVLFEALDRVLSQCGGGEPTRDSASGGRPPAERALAHEENYWRFTAPTAHRGSPDLLRQCAGLATLAGASDRGQADALLSLPARLAGPGTAHTRQELASWLNSLYDGPGVLNPLRPDRLGEALVSQILRDQDDAGRTLLGAVLSLPSDEQAERCLDVLGRLTAYDEAVARAAAAAIADVHIALAERAEEQSHGTPGSPGRTDLAGAFQRLLTPRFCALIEQELADAEPGNTTYRRDLSVSFNKLADLALAAGRSADAESLYRQSLQVRQELADAEPGNTTYRRDLSVSFERLADLALAAGRSADAESLYRQSLQVAQELADAEPGNTTYRRDLSVSFERLADLALAAGRSADAESLYRQSLQVRQELADAEPGNTTYRRDLSVSFERLADLANRQGESALADQWVSKALEIRRQLVRDEPGRLDFAEELAYTLYLTASIHQSSDPTLAQEAGSLLEPFERLGYVTPRASALLAWARQES